MLHKCCQNVYPFLWHYHYEVHWFNEARKLLLLVSTFLRPSSHPDTVQLSFSSLLLSPSLCLSLLLSFSLHSSIDHEKLNLPEDENNFVLSSITQTSTSQSFLSHRLHVSPLSVTSLHRSLSPLSLCLSFFTWALYFSHQLITPHIEFIFYESLTLSTGSCVETTVGESTNWTSRTFATCLLHHWSSTSLFHNAVSFVHPTHAHKQIVEEPCWSC